MYLQMRVKQKITKGKVFIQQPCLQKITFICHNSALGIYIQEQTSVQIMLYEKIVIDLLISHDSRKKKCLPSLLAIWVHVLSTVQNHISE